MGRWNCITLWIRLPSQLIMTDKKFGRLTIVERDMSRMSHQYYICKCECGNVTSTRLSRLKNGSTRSCGCLANELTSQRSQKNLIGRKFGKLEVLDFAGKDRWGQTLYKCKCDCGKDTVVPGYGLTRKVSPYRSCGCITVERMRKLGKRMWKENKLGISKSATLFLDMLENMLNVPIAREVSLSNYLYDGGIGKILIEVDGAYWHRTAYQKQRDQEKNTFAKTNGFKLFRFSVRRQNEVTSALKKYASQIEEIKQCLS